MSLVRRGERIAVAPVPVVPPVVHVHLDGRGDLVEDGPSPAIAVARLEKRLAQLERRVTSIANSVEASMLQMCQRERDIHAELVRIGIAPPVRGRRRAP